MDEIVKILVGEAENEDPSQMWELVNNGAVVVVKAVTARSYRSPDLAFAAAKTLADHLAVGTYTYVNRVELGVRAQPIADERGWRGTIDACLWRSEELSGYHQVVDLN